METKRLSEMDQIKASIKECNEELESIKDKQQELSQVENQIDIRDKLLEICKAADMCDDLLCKDKLFKADKLEMRETLLEISSTAKSLIKVAHKYREMFINYSDMLSMVEDIVMNELEEDEEVLRSMEEIDATIDEKIEEPKWDYVDKSEDSEMFKKIFSKK